MQEIYYLPDYLLSIINRLKECDWLTHNFQINNNEDLYNPAAFLSNKDIEYMIYLDVNVYQYLLNTIKKDFSKEEFKNALALLIFAQVSKINFEPNLAIYEKINYTHNDNNLNEIINDLNIFNCLNNCMRHDLFLRYIKGTDNNLQIEKKDYEKDTLQLKEQLTKYKSLKGWKSLYLMMLNICYINLDENLTNEKKLIKFCDWMIKEYRMSFVMIVYAVVYFGNSPLRRMMKYKKSDTIDNRKSAITNMTWDLYLLDKFFKDWRTKNNRKEIMFASADKAFSNLLRLAIDCQKDESIEKLAIYLNKNTYEYIDKITSISDDCFERKYQSDIWSIEYRDELIENFEKLLNIVKI